MWEPSAAGGATRGVAALVEAVIAQAGTIEILHVVNGPAML
ncbi:MAG: hypothetical protein ABI072_02895 [Edaphobacter sp.]